MEKFLRSDERSPKLPYMGRQCASLTAHSKDGGREKTELHQKYF